MFKLELKKQAAAFTNWNPRVEKHGKESIGAADLSFRFDAPNEILDCFAPELRQHLYCRAEGEEAAQQELIEGEAERLPKLRFTEMSPFEWTRDIDGGVLTLHYGIGEEGDVELCVTKVTDFKLHPKDGGTVTIQMKVKCRPDAEHASTLWTLMVLESVQISFAPPEPAPAQSDLGAES